MVTSKYPVNTTNQTWHVSTFHIVDVQGPAVLGLPLLEQVKQITLHCTVKKEDVFQTPVATWINATKDLMLMYPDQFNKIGSMPGAVRLSINKNIHPHIDTPRKTPIVLKDYIKQELDNRVKNKIISKETKADPVLDQLQGIITAGWPDSIKDLPPVIRSYWPYRDKLSVNDGIIMKGSRIIIPETQQKIILDQLHYSLQGVHVFKPEMQSDYRSTKTYIHILTHQEKPQLCLKTI